MIKESNERVFITLPKKQLKWAKEQAKKLNLTLSRFIMWMLAKKAQEIYEYQKFQEASVQWNDFQELIHFNMWNKNE